MLLFPFFLYITHTCFLVLDGPNFIIFAVNSGYPCRCRLTLLLLDLVFCEALEHARICKWSLHYDHYFGEMILRW